MSCVIIAVARPSTIGSKTQIDVKSNVSSNIKIILEYLIENEYPSVLTKKNLMNPTEATFKAIFKFIIRDFYPDFECTRLANDVIFLLNALDYPYPLKESHFTPIGSPHSWPHLLEALAFTCNLSRMMAYENENVSQLYTLSAKDEEEVEEELNHQVLAASCYRDYQNESGDHDAYVQRYLEELDTEGKLKVLEREKNRTTEEMEIVKENNNRFSETEAGFKIKFDNLKAENIELEKDKTMFIQCIEDKGKEGESAQEECEEKESKLGELKESAICTENEINRIEEIIAEQPPQHEVQTKKQCLNDLVDKVGSIFSVAVGNGLSK